MKHLRVCFGFFDFILYREVLHFVKKAKVQGGLTPADLGVVLDGMGFR